MTTATISLTEKQSEVFVNEARFKLVVAGRRFGKTTLAAIMCITSALAETNSHGEPLDSDSEVVFFGVDREQAKRNAWNMLKDMARSMGVFVKAYENNCVLTVNNGVKECRIRLLGMDNPDSARGMKIRFAVLDEYADMPEEAWSEIIRPALMDTRGGAMFIGTPKGKNHFFEMFVKIKLGEQGPDWSAFEYSSHDNSTLNKDELDLMAAEYAKGSPELFAQEIGGKFIAKGGQLFHSDDFIIDSKEPDMGSIFISVDLAGFGRTSGKKNAEIKRLDESVICISKAYPTEDKYGKSDIGWWVKDIQHGRWGVEETAARIVDAFKEHQAQAVGIEAGALKNAVEPYLEAYQQSRRVWFHPVALRHGNTKKYDRIQWALQGRVKRGLVKLNQGEWNSVLIEQAVDFPSRLSHDDLIDALAYQDQIAEYIEFDFNQQDRWEALDDISGY